MPTFLVFAAFRTYALWNKDLRVLCCVLLLGMLYPCGYAVSTLGSTLIPRF